MYAEYSGLEWWACNANRTDPCAYLTDATTGVCVTCNSTNKTITKLLQKYYKNSIMGFERHKRGDKTMAEN